LTGVVAIAAGGWHSLALKRDGRVVAWGADYSRQSTVPSDLTNAVAIAAGFNFSLALTSQGTVLGWGEGSSTNHLGPSDFGQAAIPPGLNDVVAIDAGYWHSVALKRSGTVVAWGDNQYGQTNVPPNLTNVIAVVAGAYYTLALGHDGRVTAWGRNTYGETAVPTGLTNVVALAAGFNHSVALEGLVPPFLAIQPAAQTVYSGTEASFGVTANGHWPLSFQWRLNGQGLAGETNATLKLTAVGVGNGGLYGVVVTNAFGSEQSRDALLTVVDSSPLVVVPPADQSTYRGGPARFSVGADGSRPLSYQWMSGEVAIVGATNYWLALDPVGTNQAGLYRVVLSNAFGAVTSTPAGLRVVRTRAVVWGSRRTTPSGYPDIVGMSPGYFVDWYLGGDRAAFGVRTDGITLPGLSNVSALASGYSGAIALRLDGSVVPLSSGYTDGQFTSWTNMIGIAAGYQELLGVRQDGTVTSLFPWDPAETNSLVGLSNVVAVAAGYPSQRNLALQVDGTVVDLGPKTAYQQYLPAGLSDVLMISSGNLHALALKRNGTVVAWGNNDFGQASVPPGLSNVVAIAAGSWNSLVLLEDGSLVGWGHDLTSLINAPFALSNAVAIASGNEHNIVLVGDGSPGVTLQPLDRRVFSGREVTFEVRAAGTPPLSYQWHFNGAAIAGATSRSLVLKDPQLSAAGVYAVTVSNARDAIVSRAATLTVVESPPFLLAAPTNQVTYPGGTVTLRVTGDGSGPLTYQWRYGDFDIPGATNASLTLENLRATLAGEISVRVSNGQGIYLTDGVKVRVQNVVAWGNNFQGQTSVPLDPGEVVAVLVGRDHTLALHTDGTVVSWSGIEITATNIPPGMTNVVAIAAGIDHSLALLRDGRVVAWGGNNQGATEVPDDLTNAVAIAANDQRSLAVTGDGHIVGWGRDGVFYHLYGWWWREEITNIVAVALGAAHSLALLGDGTVFAWGSSVYGQAEVPPDLSNVVAVAAGYYHSLALRRDGTVVAWGEDFFGQSSVPAGLGDVVAIAGGATHSVALKDDGTIVTWGRITTQISGQDPQVIPAFFPAGLINVRAIAAGDSLTVALAGQVAEQPPLRLIGPHREQTRFHASLESQRGVSYFLESTESPGSGTWNILPPFPGDGHWVELTDPLALAPVRFYRVRTAR